MSVRQRVWEILEVAHPGDRASHVFDIFLVILILLNIIAEVAGHFDAVQARYGFPLYVFEVISVLIFTIEYLGRLWSCVVAPEYARPIVGRARFAVRPMPMANLLAVLPFYLPFTGLDLRFLRALRLLRIANLRRYLLSLTATGKVVTRAWRRRRSERP